MSKTQTQPASAAAGYVDFDEYIDYQLRKARGGIHQTDVLFGSVVLGLIAFSYLLVFVIFDQWIIPNGFSPTTRLILLGLVLTGSLSWAFYRIVLPLLQQINVLYAARQIERAFPELKSTLLTWVELRNSGREIPQEIRSAIEKRAALEMSHQDVDRAVDRQLLLRASYGLLAVVFLFCAYSIFTPKNVTSSIWRALFPTSATSVATRTEILEVKPGDTEVLARAQLEVSATLAGVIPKEVTLLYTTADRRFVDEPVTMRPADEGTNRYQGLLTGENGRGLVQDLTYHIQAGDARTREFTVRINQPPSAAVHGIDYDFPKYMGLDDTAQSGSTIDAWEGTTVTVRAESNVPVKRATLIMSDTDDISVRAEELPMTITEGTQLAATWQLQFRGDGTFARYYHIQVENDRGQQDPLPSVHTIKIRPDRPPEVAFLSPTSDIKAPANAIIPLAFQARDPDFMLRRVTLRFEKHGEELPVAPTLYEGPPYHSATRGQYRLDLSKFAMQPGERLTFYLEAEDNMEPFGDRLGNKRRTPKLNVDIIDPAPPEQVQKDLQQQEQAIRDQLQEDQRQPQEQQGNMPPDQQPEEGMGDPMPENPQDNQPNEKPGQQGNDPGQQGNQPGQQGNQPGQQGNQPGQQGNQPGQQGNQPGQQGNQPGQQGNRPGQQGNQPGQQGNQPGQQGNQPGQQGNQPGQQGNQPGQQGNQPGMQGNQPGQQGNQPGQQGNQPGQQGNQSGKQGNRPGQHGSSDSASGSDSRNERAEDDEALRELLKWHEEQKQRKNQEGNSPSNAPGQQGDQPGEQGTQPGQQGNQPGQQGMDRNQQPGENGDTPQAPDANRQPGQQGNQPMPNGTPDGNEGEGATPDSTPMPPKGRHGDGLKPQPMTGDTPNEQGNQPGQQGNQPGQQGDQPGQQGNQPGQQGNQPGQQGNQPGQQGNQPGQQGNQPGQQGNQPGQQGNQPGQQGNQPGQQGNQPGQQGNQPGQQGNQPGQQGNPPGQQGNQPGQQGNQPGQQGNQPGQQGNQPGRQGNQPGQQGNQPGQQGNQPGQQGNQPGQQGNQPGQQGNQPGQQGNQPGQQGNQPGQQGNQPGQQGNQPGQQGNQPGQQGNQPGQQGNQPGQQGNQPGQQGNQPGQQGNQPGQQGNQPGQQGNQPGQQGNQPGQQGNQAGQPGGQPRGLGPGNPDGQGGVNPGGNSDDAPVTPEAADLENRKRSTDLALKQLRDQLERGDTPQELMDQLGFTERDLNQFMQRLEQRLSDTGSDQSPEAESARRQFESLLKGVDYKSTGARRDGGDGPRTPSESFGAANRPVPPEYRKDVEAYKKKVSE